MPPKTPNISAPKDFTPQPGVEALYAEKMKKARKEWRAEKAGGEGRQLIEWAEQHGENVWGGRITRLKNKYMSGLIKPAETFKLAMKEIAKKPEKREQDVYKKLIDHLTQGNLLGFGINFKTILEALESEDPREKALAESFIMNSAGIQDERGFLKEVKALRKERVTAADVQNSVQAQISLADQGRAKPQRLAADILRDSETPLIEVPSEEKQLELKDATINLTTATEKATQASKNISKALEVIKLKDPKFSEEQLRLVLADYDILKKSTETLNNPKLSAALAQFEADRKKFGKSLIKLSAEEDDTIHKLFLQSRQSKLSQETLLAAARENLEPFIEMAFKLDLERAMDNRLRDAVDEDQKVEAKDLTQSIEDVKKKYNLQTVELSPQDTKKLHEAVESAVAPHKERIQRIKELEKPKTEFEAFAQHALEIEGPNGHAEDVCGMAGIELFKRGRYGELIGKTGMKISFINPQQVKNEADDELKSIARDASGKALKVKKTATLVSATYEPITEGEIDDQFRQNHAWHPQLILRGEPKIVLEIDGKQEEFGSKKFRNWATAYDAHEVIEDKSEVGVELKAGMNFLLKSEFNNKLEFDLVEIVDVDEKNRKVKLSKPLKYIRREEFAKASLIRPDRPKQELSYGEFKNYLLRRKGNIFQIPDEVPQNTKSGETIGSKYGEGVLAEGLTPEQKAIILSIPLIEQETEEPDLKTSRPHLVKKYEPAVRRLMSTSRKYDGEAETPDKSHAEHQPSHNTPAKGDRHIHPEALSIADTHATGHAHMPEVNYFEGLWQRTRILATDDFMGLFKAMYEYYERNWHRRSKEKFSSVGQGLPWWGTEMGRVKQAAEDEEVHQFMEAMEHWGEWDVYETIRSTHNKDQLKACFEVLSKKGMLRWDDVQMWNTMNRFLPASKKIPIPPHHNAMMKDAKTGKTGLDYLQPAIDYMWGEGTWNEMYAHNNQTYSTHLKEYYEKGKHLEGDPKGNRSTSGELELLLRRHKQGGYVDSHEYEGLLHFLIDAGKGAAEDKLYYMIEGVAAVNPVSGESILSMERMGSINGEFLNRFPMMDYITRRDVPRPDGTVSQWSLEDYRAWCKKWDEAGAREGKDCRPSSAVKDHMWKYVLTDERTIIRNNKGLRKAQDMDHDDAHIIIPLADEELIEDITLGAGGKMRFFTKEGFANAYPGYNQYWKTLAEKGEVAKMKTAIKSFVRFDAIMENRHKKGNNDYSRLGDSMWNRPSVVDSRETGWHKKQLQNVIKQIANAYGDSTLIDLINTLHMKTGSISDPVQAEEQNKVQRSVDEFNREFDRVVKKDGGAKMIQVVNSAELSGMGTPMSQLELLQRQTLFAEQDDTDKVFTDWKSED